MRIIRRYGARALNSLCLAPVVECHQQARTIWIHLSSYPQKNVRVWYLCAKLPPNIRNAKASSNKNAKIRTKYRQRIEITFLVHFTPTHIFSLLSLLFPLPTLRHHCKLKKPISCSGVVGLRLRFPPQFSCPRPLFPPE